MPRTILKRRLEQERLAGLSSVPASIEPIITDDPPAASALTASPEH
jgi:hypothetical protein